MLTGPPPPVGRAGAIISSGRTRDLRASRAEVVEQLELLVPVDGHLPRRGARHCSSRPARRSQSAHLPPQALRNALKPPAAGAPTGSPCPATRACVRVGVQRVLQVLQVWRLEVDPDLLHTAMPVGEDELPWGVIGPVVVPRPRRQRGQHGLVAHPGRHPQQPQRLGLRLVVVGTSDEHRVHQRGEPADPEQVAGQLGGEQRSDVELPGVAGQPVDQHLPGRHLGQEVRLVERHALAQVAVHVVDGALGEPARQVQQFDGERLAVGPLLARAARTRQASCPAWSARSAGTPGPRARGRRGRCPGTAGRPAAAPGARPGSRRPTLAWSSPSLACRRSVSITCPGCRSGGPPTSRTARSSTIRVCGNRATSNGSSPVSTSSTSRRRVAAASDRSRRQARSGSSSSTKCSILRLGHHPVRVEDAGLGAQQVDVPGERGQLGQPGQLGQRSGRVQHRPARTGPQRLVDDQTGQERLSRPQPADHRGQARGPAHLLGQPRDPRRPAAGSRCRSRRA